MLNVHRRTHLIVWLVIAPTLVMLIWLGLSKAPAWFTQASPTDTHQEARP